MIGLHLNIQAHVAGPYPLMLLIGIEALPPGPRGALIQRASRINQCYNEFSTEGLADGGNRPSDVQANSLSGAGCAAGKGNS